MLINSARLAASPARRNLIGWGCVSCAYAVAFLQRVCPQTISDELARDFGIGADGLGVIASSYFIGYMLMQFPAGVLVDTFGVKKLVVWSLAASSVGTLLFAASTSVPFAFVSRFAIACGDALIFTALIKLVAQQFRERQFGLMSGLSQLSGYAGGALAATPLAVAVASAGWRTSFAVIGLLSCINLALAARVLPRQDGIIRPATLAAVLTSAIAELKRRESWGCLLTFSSHFITVTTISGVWGVPLLMDTLDLPRHSATSILLLFMTSCMIGSIGFGFIADRTRSLRRVHVTMCLVRTASLVLLAPAVSGWMGLGTVVASFTALGLIAGGMTPMILKAVRSIYSVARLGTGAAINTTSAGLLTAGLQPILGFALSQTWGGLTRGGVHVYSHAGYNLLMGILACISLSGIVGVLLMRRKI
ncbi:MFS transporter [Bradyrhizobium sp. 2TAF24]|uniref:MFS transporter n=1 Tax=Bradyrhizobium sp. 2TAF24 TaxID=3233011 RepID=UPI003F93DA09